MTVPPSTPRDYQAVRRLAARFGSDPMHIQGAGGNGSVKEGGTMWIKASGTLMGAALKQDVFVATNLKRMRAALEQEDPTADQPALFTLDAGAPLRPSIETSLHAVFDQRIVLHTHCIHTLAYAVRQNVQELLEDRLADFNWRFVEYAKPGAHLARSVRNALAPDTRVIVLANHGLIVSGDTVDDVANLQEHVHQALAQPAADAMLVDTQLLERLVEGTEFCLPDDPVLHQLAIDPHRARQVAAGSLYPDHVIFCGIGVPALRNRESIPEALRRSNETGQPAPLWFLVPGHGVVVRADLKEPARVMMRCLADVMARVPKDASLNYLTLDQNLELLNWDAEKYRQSLNA